MIPKENTYQPFPALWSFSLSMIIRVGLHLVQPAGKMVRRADQLLTGRQLTPKLSSKIHLCITVKRRSSNVCLGNIERSRLNHMADLWQGQMPAFRLCSGKMMSWSTTVELEKSLISGRGQSWLKIVSDVQGARIWVGAWLLPHVSSLEVAFKDVLQNRDFSPMAS